MSALGALLREFRKESGLTQEELAERAGVSSRTVSDTERGLRMRLYADTAERLAAGLGLDGSSRESFVEVARGRGRATDVAGTCRDRSRRWWAGPWSWGCWWRSCSRAHAGW